MIANKATLLLRLNDITVDNNQTAFDNEQHIPLSYVPKRPNWIKAYTECYGVNHGARLSPYSFDTMVMYGYISLFTPCWLFVWYLSRHNADVRSKYHLGTKLMIRLTNKKVICGRVIHWTKFQHTRYFKILFCQHTDVKLNFAYYNNEPVIRVLIWTLL